MREGISNDETGPNEDSLGFELRSVEYETKKGTIDIKYLVCVALEQAGFINAFSTRTGGVSGLPKDALNLGYFSGDLPANVEENRLRFLDVIGGSQSRLITARQTHSTTRFGIRSLADLDAQEPECDALLTTLPDVLLGVKTADCLPILIADPKSGTMAAIHAGWRGTAGRIAERTIADLMRDFGVNPRNCLAAFGPVACGDCYEVGEDVIKKFKSEFGYWQRLMTMKERGKANLDIRAANRQQLVYCGFSDDRIFTAPFCTMHNNDLFFSYRGDGRGGGVGKLLSVIGRARV